jgi:hypothetical protein
VDRVLLVSHGRWFLVGEIAIDLGIACLAIPTEAV